MNALCEAANKIEVGMEFRELYAITQSNFKKYDLNNDWTKVDTDPAGTNLGHTVPWSYEDPTMDELSILEKGNQLEINNIIRYKRLYVNKLERFKIPNNIAFTLEARLDNNFGNGTTLPNSFFHLMILMQDGKREVLSDFDRVKSAVMTPLLL